MIIVKIISTLLLFHSKHTKQNVKGFALFLEGTRSKDQQDQLSCLLSRVLFPFSDRYMDKCNNKDDDQGILCKFHFRVRVV